MSFVVYHGHIWLCKAILGLGDLSGGPFGPGSLVGTLKSCLERWKCVQYIPNHHTDGLSFIQKSFVTATAHGMSYPGVGRRVRPAFDQFDGKESNFNASKGDTALFSTQNNGGYMSSDLNGLIMVDWWVFQYEAWGLLRRPPGMKFFQIAGLAFPKRVIITT